jgi:hypothetical protein
MFVWLVTYGWCWFVLREKYCWLVADGWFVLREKYRWLVADKPNEQASQRGRKNLIFFFNSQTTTAASLERSMVVHLIHITSCSSLIPFRPHKRVPEYIVSQNEVAKQHREIDLSMHPSLRN